MNLTVGSIASLIPAPASPRLIVALQDGSGLAWYALAYAVVVTAVETPALDAPVETTTALEPVIFFEGRLGTPDALLVSPEGDPLPYEVTLR